jgi:hypothetical protein
MAQFTIHIFAILKYTYQVHKMHTNQLNYISYENAIRPLVYFPLFL